MEKHFDKNVKGYHQVSTIRLTNFFAHSCPEDPIVGAGTKESRAESVSKEAWPSRSQRAHHLANVASCGLRLDEVLDDLLERHRVVISSGPCLCPRARSPHGLKLPKLAWSSHLHFLVNLFGSCVESSSEQEWEAHDVVDLVGVVRSSVGDDAIWSPLLGKLRRG